MLLHRFQNNLICVQVLQNLLFLQVYQQIFCKQLSSCLVFNIHFIIQQKYILQFDKCLQKQFSCHIHFMQSLYSVHTGASRSIFLSKSNQSVWFKGNVIMTLSKTRAENRIQRENFQSCCPVIQEKKYSLFSTFAKGEAK